MASSTRSAAEVLSLEGAVADYLHFEEWVCLSSTCQWLRNESFRVISEIGLRCPSEGTFTPTKERLSQRLGTFRMLPSGPSPLNSPRYSSPSSPSLFGTMLRRVLSRGSESSPFSGSPVPDDPDLPRGPASRLLARCHKLKTLRLINQSALTAAAEALRDGQCSHLQSLIISKVNLEALFDAAALLSQALPALPSLETLDMSHNCLLGDAATALGQALGDGACPRLTTLLLGGFSNRMGQSGLAALAAGMQRRAKLTAPSPSETPTHEAVLDKETSPKPLSSDAQAGKPGAPAGIRGLMHARHLSVGPCGGPTTPVPLRCLSLGASEGEVGEGALDGLWGSLLPGMEELELWCGGSGPMAMTGLAVGLAQMGGAGKLRVLRVRGEREGVVGGGELVLGRMGHSMGPGLRVLELHRCALGAEALGAFLAGKGVALETLRVRECWLACGHVGALARALGSGPTAAGPTLKVLDLSDNPEVGRAGAEALADAIKAGTCPHLEVLDLGGTSLTDDGVVALGRALRCCGVAKGLQRLGLRKVGVCCRGVRALLPLSEREGGLGGCLRELDLAQNEGLGRDGGVEALAGALRAGLLERLEWLDVSDVAMVKETAEELAGVLRSGAGKRLRRVWVGRVHEAPDMEAMLVAAGRRRSVQVVPYG